MNPTEKSEWILSKTSFIRGRQCLKSLYLHKYHRNLKTLPTAEQEKVFKKGKSFERQFRQACFPTGVDLNLQLGDNFAGYFPQTKTMLSGNHSVVLFEAGIVSQGVLVLVDVLKKNEDDTIDIFEVKNNAHLKSSSLWDASLQYFVCKSFFGNWLNSFHVILKGNRHPFKTVNVTEQVEKRQERIRHDIELFTSVLLGTQEPETAMGKHCSLPYECGFKGYCKKKKMNQKLFH